MTLPSTTTSRVSIRLSPNVIPKAPSTQLIGAMLAPDQIQNSSHGEQSRLWSGIGSMPCASNGTPPSSATVVELVVGESIGLMDILQAPHVASAHRNTAAAGRAVYKHPLLPHVIGRKYTVLSLEAIVDDP